MCYSARLCLHYVNEQAGAEDTKDSEQSIIFFLPPITSAIDNIDEPLTSMNRMASSQTDFGSDKQYDVAECDTGEYSFTTTTEV